MDERRKAVSFSTTVKTKAVDDERRIVFVASSNGLDRHYEHVDVQSLRLPKKAGGSTAVKDIDGELTDIDIPLMLNHSADVSDVIGSVRKAYTNAKGELVFEAGISKRQVAQDMMTLIDEGHLNNAFSITMSDFDYDEDTDTISDAEVIEVSLVYRGSNKEARLLAVKSILGGKDMAEAIKKALTAEEAEQLTGAIVEAVEQAVSSVVEDNGDGEENTEPETDTPDEQTESKEADVEGEKSDTPEAETAEESEAQAEETEAEEAEETEDEEVEETKEEKAMNKEIAKSNVVEGRAKQEVSDAKAKYLDSDDAVKKFAEIVFTNKGKGSWAEAWKAHLASKDITGDPILPTQVSRAIFKGWEDHPSLLSTFNFIGRDEHTSYVLNTADEAQLWSKDSETPKEIQELQNASRVFRTACIYKKQVVNHQDLQKAGRDELVRFIVDELRDRIATKIVYGMIVGGAYDEQTNEGIVSIVDDLKADSGIGKITTTNIDNVATDKEYQVAVKTLGAVKDINGQGKVLVVPEGFLTNLRLSTKENGDLLFPVGTKVEDVLGAVRVEELPGLEASGYKAIAYTVKKPTVNGREDVELFTDFDHEWNKDVFLMERNVGGGLEGYHVAAGYKAE